MQRRGLTLLEVLAVAAIVGILLALMLPAVQGAREAGRRIQCSSNIRQLALALHAYEGIYHTLPHTSQNNYSFHVSLLPYLEERVVFQAFDFSLNAMDYRGPLLSRRITVFECPSDASRDIVPGLPALTNYHGNWGTGNLRYGNNGIFSYHDDRPGFVRFLPFSAITDGLGQTAMLSEVIASDNSSHWLRVLWKVPPVADAERIEEFAEACRDAPRHRPALSAFRIARGRPWLECGRNWTVYNHMLTPNQASCANGTWFASGAFTSTSYHRGRVNVAMADGSVHVVPDSIDITAWRAIGSRAAGDP